MYMYCRYTALFSLIRPSSPYIGISLLQYLYVCFRIVSVIRLDISLFSQAQRRKDSPLISAGGRLNSENSPVPLKYATLLGQINVRCRESMEQIISQSTLLLVACAPGRAGHTHKHSRPITAKLQIDREVV